MNFFERQRQVRRLSWRLVFLFAVAVVGIVLTVDLAVVFALGGFDRPIRQTVGVMLLTSLATGAGIGLASLYRTLSLRAGGGKVARDLGGVGVPADTTDPRLRRLRNVVEEIAIASGVPVPEVYVLPDEPGINAFAAGWSPSDAAVAVTRGALERLNRDELQGVIAHEFSHVLNGDMRLNIRLMGLLYGILALAVVGRSLLYLGGRRVSRSAAPIFVAALAALFAGYIGFFVGRLIQAAVSRQREYLADASAVQFTRQTAGLAGALKKIAGLPAGSAVRTPKAAEVAHMLFGAGRRLSGLWSTHPPLLDRIRVLDPGTSAAELDELARRWAVTPPSGMAEDQALGLAAADRRSGATGATARPDAGSGILPPSADTEPVTPAGTVAQVGTPTAAAYQRAATLLDNVPAELLDRVRRPDSVVPVLLGLLLSSQPDVRARQQAALTSCYGTAVAEAAAGEADKLAHLHPLLRLPVVELAAPVLRGLPQPERDSVMRCVKALIEADGRLSVSEYCLARLLHRELYESAHRAPPWGQRHHGLAASQGAVAVLLATLAGVGHADHRAAVEAFRAGLNRVLPDAELAYRPPGRGVLDLETAWAALDGLGPADKSRLVEAMVTVISHDGVMTLAEFELLRTVCAILHCPLPAVVDQPRLPASADPPRTR